MSLVRLSIIALTLLAAQVYFALSLRLISPPRDLLDVPPSQRLADALGLGDRQLLFRAYALHVQGAGDTGGRIVPIKNYDFDRVVGWLDTMSDLDSKSQFPVGIGIRYFGASQDLAHIAPIVRFAMRDVDKNPAEKWLWLYEAIYLARYRLGDLNLALEAANQLASYPDSQIPPIAKFSPALVLEEMGQWAEAGALVEGLLSRYGRMLSPDDEAWARRYLAFLRRGEPRP